MFPASTKSRRFADREANNGRFGSGRKTLLAALLLFLGWGLAPPASAQEAGRVSGRVSEAGTGAPLADVQLYLVGTDFGAISRTSGNYLMTNVPAGTYELRADRIGLGAVTRQITVVAGQTLEENFDMAQQALGLDEIVVTGTAGAARRREVGNQVTQINTVDLPERPTSVMDMLQSMAPGVEVSLVGGGGELGQGSNITIRGINTIQSGMQTPPIIFIDGIRIMSDNLPTRGAPGFIRAGANNNSSPLDQLNPNDIERIEIISGPAASTLYGTEAAAGVIQVFTKKGAARAPVWTADVMTETNWMPAYGPDYVDPTTGRSTRYIFMDPWICTAPFQCGDFMDVPITHNSSLSVRGGAQALQYFVSGGFNSDKGSTPQDQSERWNVRGNFTFTPLNDLVLSWNTAYTNTWQQNTASGNNADGLVLNVFRQDQAYFGTKDPAEINAIIQDWGLDKEIERFTSGATLQYSPIRNLTNRFTIGYDFTQQESKNIRAFGFVTMPEGAIDVNVYSRRYLSFDYVGTYSFNVIESLRSSFSWGGQSTGDFQSDVSAYGEGFPGAAKPTVNSASSTLGFETRRTVWNSGFFFQNVFDLHDKYFLTLGLRVDGNSTFGKNFNLAMYPKASGAWVMSDEAFWRPELGEMKLRWAWGKSGRAPGAFVAQRTWSNSGLAGEPAFVPGNLGNPDIGPEVTTELELGFDASWLGDKVRPRFTWYRQTTKDAIQNVSSIPSLGFTSNVRFNIGEVQNGGKELALDVTALRTRNWGLDFGTSLSKNWNEVIKWAGETDPSSSARIGRPISYSTWTLNHNPEGMGTSRRTSGSYQRQNCYTQNTSTLLSLDPSEWTPRPGLDPTIHACGFPSQLLYGFPMSRPSVVVGGNASLRLPYSISLSARGDYRGGRGYWRTTNAMGTALGRNVIIPLCLPYYEDTEEFGTLLRPDTPAVWDGRCFASGSGTNYAHKGNEFVLRSLSLTMPVDFAFPDRVNNASLTVVFNNIYKYNDAVYRWYSAGSTERIPVPQLLRASLRVTF